ncbi:hypothetical protein [Flagellimonas flava]|uniref:Uncharacterized protein n=1 Tax=Flagellimonas flava TaxID=570519 RepID=A0A1M5IRL5_9FLAO|nr:hypothetical protein [Allomuricauda flava]SHG30886.1 hypothetical protein SAMN04488116_0882 [Allomuricauda flava]
MSDAIWALIGVVVGGLLTGWINYGLQKRQFQHNFEMFRLENQSKETVKSILTDLLWHKKFIDRSMKALKQNIGGYTEDEIRQLLHEVGAVKTTRKKDNTEWWYLKERGEERIEYLKRKS